VCNSHGDDEHPAVMCVCLHECVCVDIWLVGVAASNLTTFNRVFVYHLE